MLPTFFDQTMPFGAQSQCHPFHQSFLPISQSLFHRSRLRFRTFGRFHLCPLIPDVAVRFEQDFANRFHLVNKTAIHHFGRNLAHSIRHGDPRTRNHRDWTIVLSQKHFGKAIDLRIKSACKTGEHDCNGLPMRDLNLWHLFRSTDRKLRIPYDHVVQAIHIAMTNVNPKQSTFIQPSNQGLG